MECEPTLPALLAEFMYTLSAPVRALAESVGLGLFERRNEKRGEEKRRKKEVDKLKELGGIRGGKNIPCSPAQGSINAREIVKDGARIHGKVRHLVRLNSISS